MLRSYAELSMDYARQRAGEGSRRLARGAVSLCNAGMNRQRGGALLHRMMFNLVEGSLLRDCIVLSKGSGRDYQTQFVRLVHPFSHAGCTASATASSEARNVPPQAARRCSCVAHFKVCQIFCLGRPGMTDPTAFVSAPV